MWDWPPPTDCYFCYRDVPLLNDDSNPFYQAQPPPAPLTRACPTTRPPPSARPAPPPRPPRRTPLLPPPLSQTSHSPTQLTDQLAPQKCFAERHVYGHYMHDLIALPHPGCVNAADAKPPKLPWWVTLPLSTLAGLGTFAVVGLSVLFALVLCILRRRRRLRRARARLMDAASGQHGNLQGNNSPKPTDNGSPQAASTF